MYTLILFTLTCRWFPGLLASQNSLLSNHQISLVCFILESLMLVLFVSLGKKIWQVGCCSNSHHTCNGCNCQTIVVGCAWWARHFIENTINTLSINYCCRSMRGCFFMERPTIRFTPWVALRVIHIPYTLLGMKRMDFFPSDLLPLSKAGRHFSFFSGWRRQRRRTQFQSVVELFGTRGHSFWTRINTVTLYMYDTYSRYLRTYYIYTRLVTHSTYVRSHLLGVLFVEKDTNFVTAQCDRTNKIKQQLVPLN